MLPVEKHWSRFLQTLSSTYERILERVNSSNGYSQRLVQRALRWILADQPANSLTVKSVELTAAALCEAISIEDQDLEINSDAILDEGRGSEVVQQPCEKIVP